MVGIASFHVIEEPLFGVIIIVERNIVVANIIELLDEPEEQYWFIQIILLKRDKSNTFSGINEEQPFRPLIIRFIIGEVGGYFYRVGCQRSKPFWMKQ